jgi:hypothetical protein
MDATYGGSNRALPGDDMSLMGMRRNALLMNTENMYPGIQKGDFAGATQPSSDTPPPATQPPPSANVAQQPQGSTAPPDTTTLTQDQQSAHITPLVGQTTSQPSQPSYATAMDPGMAAWFGQMNQAAAANNTGAPVATKQPSWMGMFQSGGYTPSGSGGGR